MTDIFMMIVCHLVGDYVLQGDFIAKTKGENWYHLLVHVVLYAVPFYIAYGISWVVFLLPTHFVIDALKARYKKINYATDQILHYAVIVALYFALGV